MENLATILANAMNAHAGALAYSGEMLLGKTPPKDPDAEKQLSIAHADKASAFFRSLAGKS